jgi:GNAT superfamily N-acetyltransferase
MTENFVIKPATIDDVPLILQFIRELAAYEKLLHEVVATEEILRETLFGECGGSYGGSDGSGSDAMLGEAAQRRGYAEVVIGYYDGAPVSFALFFHNFSTFLGRPGIYLEDLYVKPEMRGKGLGKRVLSYLAQLALQRKCGRLEWWVLDWNKSAIDFYLKIGAKPMDEWTVFRVTGDALDKLAQV